MNNAKQIGWCVLLVVGAACQRQTKVEYAESSSQSILGHGVYDAGLETASDLSTESIAGTVAKLSGADGGCSGVLIGRQTILTAAHCGLITTATFSQSAVSYTVASSTANSGWNGDIPNFDLQILRLSTPVSSAVVQNVAPLFLGNINAAMRLDSHRQDTSVPRFGKNGFVVGYGRNTNCVTFDNCDSNGDGLPDANGAGIRRAGFVKDLSVALRTVWHQIDTNIEVATNHGDSGGPLFLKDEISGRYFVAGILSGGDNTLPNAQGFGTLTTDYWALTGSNDVFGGINKDHPSWIQQQLGTADGDGDGIADSIDNCPPSRCISQGLSVQSCNNPSQIDADDDAVGDACDNCAPAACAALGDSRSCTNSAQYDTDHDGVGDICDPCSSPFLTDNIISGRDDGTVGDSCNNCRPVAQHFLRCSVDSNICQNAHAGECLADKDAEGHWVSGFCSRLEDMDGDGIPNACDTCISVPSQNRNNRNEAIEIDNHATQLGDICDPVPIAPFKQEITTYETFGGSRPPYASPMNGIDYESLKVSTWLGTDATLTRAQLTENTLLQQCSCYDTASTTDELSIEECVASRCLPRAAGNVPSMWRPMTLSTQAGIAIPASGFSMNFKESTELTGASVRWESAYDITRGTNPIGSMNGRTYGVVSTAVVKTVAVSSRDAASPLRVVIEGLRSPSAQFKERRFIQACLIGACWGWVRPWEKLWNPSDKIRVPGDIRGMLRTPLLLESDLNFGSYFGSDDKLVDYSNLVSGELKEAIASKQWAWISYAERSAEVDLRGLDVQGVLVPRAGVKGNARRVGVKDGVIDFLDKPDEGGSVGMMSSGGRAVYSAVRDTLFIADQSLGDSVFMYDMNTGVRWQEVGVKNNAMGPVHGLVLDADTNRLFVLQRNDKGDREMLTMHDLANGKRTSLLSLPVSGKMESVALALDSTGAIVLAAGDAESFSLWRYVVNQEGAIVFTGNYSDAGRIGDSPLSVDLTLPVIREGSTVLVRPTVADFKGENPCSGL